MTRPCGCGGDAALECNCVVIAGAGTTVSGTGNAEDPYVVAAGRTTLAVTDTGTVDLTLAGSPDPGYTLSAAVKLSTQAQNAVVLGTDGGVFVQQGATGALVTGCGLTGAGSAASPLKLTSPQTVVAFATAGATVTYTGAQVCAGQSVTEATKLTITNPSTCQQMIVDVSGGGRIRISALDAFTSSWAASLSFMLLRDGADAGILQSVQAGRRIAGAEYYWVEAYSQAPITLAPGASTALGYRMDTSLQGPCGVDAALFNSPDIKAIGHLV